MLQPSSYWRIPSRGSTWAAWGVTLAAALLGGLLLDAERLGAGRGLEGAAPPLESGPPALFNEARYARHPGLSEPQAAFQDHPMALEHFPAGSLLPPPERGTPP